MPMKNVICGVCVVVFVIANQSYSRAESFDFEGGIQQLTMTLVNPYTGETVDVDEQKNVNTGTYNGTTGVDDVLFMTSLSDVLFIRDTLGNQVVDSTEVFFASNGDDIIVLADGIFTLENTAIFGGGGNDILWGNINQDHIFGEDGDDILNGGPGNDILVAGSGDDQLRGGDGDDKLTAGTGWNELTGGLGADQFVVMEVGNLFFSLGTFINDFNATEGDSLELSSLLVDYDPATDLLTNFISLASRAGTIDVTDFFINSRGTGGTSGTPALSVIGLQSTTGMNFGAGSSEAQLQQLVSDGLLIVTGNAVPEPSSLFLMSVTSLAILTLRRR